MLLLGIIDNGEVSHAHVLAYFLVQNECFNIAFDVVILRLYKAIKVTLILDSLEF